MWARVSEIVLGAWLGAAAFLLAGPDGGEWQRANQVICGLAVVALAALSWREPTRRAHLLELAVAGWLVGSTWLTATHPAPAATQNAVIVGLAVMLFAVVPTDASRPPPQWQARLNGEHP